MEPHVPSSELERRLVYAFLQPAARLCRRFRIPLSTAERLLRLAYYEELRVRAGATQAEIAEIFGRSRRTVVAIEQLLRSDFLAPTRAVEVERRVQAALAAGPQDAEALRRRLGVDAAEVLEALRTLVSSGAVIRSEEGRYRNAERYRSLVRQDLHARLDGLAHQLEVILETAWQRFVRRNEGFALARTLGFGGRRQDVRKMGETIVRAMRMHAIEVEEAALAHGEATELYGVTLALAPLNAAHPVNPGGGE